MSAARHSAAAPTRVLFIGGLGRSGTTVLERLLAELPGVVALGEVVHLWQRSLLHNEPCGCGRPFSDCSFWQHVGAEAFGGWSAIDARRLVEMRARLDRLRHLPRVGRRSLPPQTQRMLDEYNGCYRRVYAAAAKVAGASVVLDSSKHASQAFCLRHDSGIDLHVVHCVRDPRGVAHSWTQVVARPEGSTDGELAEMTRYSPARSALLWDAHNAAFIALARMGVPTRVVRYEQFVADPRSVVARLAVFAGLTSSDDMFRSDHEVELTTQHTASGNPIRFKTGSLVIRADDRWRLELGVPSRALVSALTVPLWHRYGYSLSGSGT